MSAQQILYRVYQQRSDGWDPVRLSFTEFIVTRETPQGYWISEVGWFGSAPRWTSKTAIRRYAHVTKREALDAFLHRKHRQVAILTDQLKQAKAATALAEQMLEKETQKQTMSNILHELTREVGGTEAEWEIVDGPETGVGIEYYYRHPEHGIYYCCDDQGHITIEQADEEEIA